MEKRSQNPYLDLATSSSCWNTFLLREDTLSVAEPPGLLRLLLPFPPDFGVTSPAPPDTLNSIKMSLRR